MYRTCGPILSMPLAFDGPKEESASKTSREIKMDCSESDMGGRSQSEGGEEVLKVYIYTE